MMPKCPDAQALKGLLDGSLPTHEQAELAEHLATCASCRKALDKLATDGNSYSQIARVLGQTPAAPEPGLQRVLDEASQHAAVRSFGGSVTDAGRTDAGNTPRDATDPGATQAETPARVRHELPFLEPPTKPGHL